MPDSRLVARVRAGDERAFEVVFDRYHRPLLAFCRHMLGTREEAEDALQHVFVSAHRSLVSGDGGKVIELRPWLYAIARNRCLSVLRARRESVALDDVPEPTGEGLAVAAEVQQREDLKDVLGDMARLPDDQRAALVLSELGALSHHEVAAVLGVRRDRVKALVFQARESLAGWRQARDTDCREIREQLATLSGSALRRAPLRRHLETCDDCRSFRSEVRRQREAMALLLPVIPSIALKAKVIGAVAAGVHGAPIAGAGLAGAGVAAGGGAAGTGGGLAAFGGGIVGKGLVVAAVAATAGGGYVVVRDQTSKSGVEPIVREIKPTGGTAPATPAAPPATALPKPASATPSATSRADRSAAAKARREAHKARDAKGRPASPGSNGLEKAPNAQGLQHRSDPTPNAGGNGRGRANGQSAAAGTQAGGRGRSSQTPAATRPVPPEKPEKPATPDKPEKPATPARSEKPATPARSEKATPRS
jgi:RNA polymerase sigma factor (sigma-70 family)